MPQDLLDGEQIDSGFQQLGGKRVPQCVRVEAAFQAQKEQQVNLARTIPVLIVYGTAIAKEDGQVFFFDDIYGNDKALAKLFAQAYTSRN